MGWWARGRVTRDEVCTCTHACVHASRRPAVGGLSVLKPRLAALSRERERERERGGSRIVKCGRRSRVRIEIYARLVNPAIGEHGWTVVAGQLGVIGWIYS